MLQSLCTKLLLLILGKVIGSDVTCSNSGSTWTEWYNLNELSDYGDNEERIELKKKGFEICNFPTALEGSVKKLYRKMSNLLSTQ